MDINLNGKVVLVTGASGGIGLSTTETLLKSGAKVMMVDTNAAELESNQKRLNSKDLATFVCDVSSEEQVKKCVSHTREIFGGVDVLFANAGIEGAAGSLLDQSFEQFNRVMSVNVTGVWLFIKYAGQLMKSKGSGSIIITSSIAGLRGSANLGPYVTSKHALMGLCKVAAAELGPFGIRVNTINPGPVDNRMMRSIEKQFSPEHPEAVKQGFVGKIPLNRYAQNQDIANMALFLASDQSAYCTGSAFVVDGGFTAS